MESSTIQKYSKYSTAKLRAKAGVIFRKWIRKRDEGERCISCGALHPSDAGHYFSVGHYPCLEFEEDNVHLQCRQCNYFKGSNAIEYRINLVKKIGEDRIRRLEHIAQLSKRTHYKHDRYFFIEKIEKYK